MSEPARIFLSYSHRDRELAQRLRAALSPLRREGSATIWSDREIGPGSDWRQEVDDHVEQADIVIVLVSADFLESDYCWGVELARALERHRAGTARVVPVVIRPVDWEQTPLGSLQALPTDARPVTSWPNRDEAWRDVSRGLRRLLADPSAVRTPGPATLQFAHVTVDVHAVPRWGEAAAHGADCVFAERCDRFFTLRDFVKNADVVLDVTLLNASPGPVVLSSVGVRFLEVRHIYYVYGIPQPVKIAPAEDEYAVDLPDLWAEWNDARPDSSPFEPGAPLRVDARASMLLPDPVYVPSRAPYRYKLRLRDFQARLPNHCRLQLVAEAAGRPAESDPVHLFTR